MPGDDWCRPSGTRLQTFRKQHLARACGEMSRRGDAIVAWHEHVFSAGYMARRARPEGARKLSPGFTLGERK